MKTIGGCAAMAAFGALGLAACVSGNPTSPGGGGSDAGGDPFMGGTLAQAQCGDTATTGLGATAPVAVPGGTGMIVTDATPKHVHVGLVNDPTTSIAILWQTADNASTVTTVRYGKATATESTQDGFSFVYIGGFSDNDPHIRVHEVHVCGLEADTTYHYQVGGVGASGTESWSAEHTFRTAPSLTADPAAQVSVVVLGDTRGGYDTWGALVKAAVMQATPDLILFTGDTVTFGQLQAEWETFYDDTGDVLASVPMLMAHGNHDSNAVNFYSLNAMPGDEQAFSLDYGAMHLVVLNDSPADPNAMTGSEQTFLSTDLAAHMNAPWKVLMHHKPMWSAALAHGSDLGVRAAWGPVVDQYAVDLVLNGHDHNYERSKPLRNGAVTAAGAGTTYVVAGSAGAYLYDNGSGFWTQYSEKAFNYVALKIRTGTIDAQAFRPDGSMLDSFTLTK